MKYALVTGGSRGIGRAICLKLADMGYNIIINYASNEKAAAETQKLITQTGTSADLMQFNVASHSEVDNAIELWKKTHLDDYISVLVNNAGIRSDATMLFMENSQWHNVVDITLNGFFYVTRKLLKDMAFFRHGRIINITSLSGLKGIPGQTNYSASRAAIIGATKALAQEVAHRKITVNAIAPGFITTDMTGNIDENSIKKTIPVGRFGTPHEVAALAAFLASKDAEYITGEVISINGGLYT
jgi:3-oxoacyl-[acyl-carrier protein] reductase